MKSCFFTGHRSFSFDNDVIDNLGALLPILVENGVTDFYTGGALGWDMNCQFAVIVMKKLYYPHVKLHFVLPCSPEKQTLNWSEKDKSEYNVMLKLADSIEIVSDDNDKDCMKKRNARLVELGDICVCYFNKNNMRSGTAQTVRMAREAEKIVLNLHFSLNK